jgi:hypothetical protein
VKKAVEVVEEHVCDGSQSCSSTMVMDDEPCCWGWARSVTGPTTTSVGYLRMVDTAAEDVAAAAGRRRR